jgi:DNA-binding transcriptional regulator GbsR (MarR family)
MTRAERPNLTPEQEAQILYLDAQFMTHAAIAEQLGVARSTVTRALQRLDTGVEDLQIRELAMLQRVKQIRKLEYIAQEAMEAWQRSKEPKRSMSKKTGKKTRPLVDPDTGEITDLTENTEDTSTTMSDQTGNPAYLAAAMKALADIRAIVGADAPVQTQSTIVAAVHNTEHNNALNQRLIASPAAQQLVHQLLVELDG